MSKTIIEGRIPLHGEITVTGAKNAALPILSAVLLLDREAIISNLPQLTDIATMIRVIKSVGIWAEYISPFTIKTRLINSLRHVAPYDLITRMRASFLIIGPLLAKTGFAKVPLPGGCSIGSRPVDLHLKGLKMMGAKINIEHGFVEARADKLKGCRIYLDFPSVGATENIIMAASLAYGVTILENAAREPEIVDLANFLNKAGAKIFGAGSPVIQIEGVNTLHSVEYKIMPDRIDAGTFILAAAITQGEIHIKGIVYEHLKPLLDKLSEAEIFWKIEDGSILVRGDNRAKAININTFPFPGFPTDMQAPIMSLFCLAKGTSIITESIFENRFTHVPELRRLGADIQIEGRSAIVNGVEKLTGCPVKIPDLRAGAALFLAALAAEGESILYGIEHVKRGYENLPEKLQDLGAKVRVIN